MAWGRLSLTAVCFPHQQGQLCCAVDAGLVWTGLAAAPQCRKTYLSLHLVGSEIWQQVLLCKTFCTWNCAGRDIIFSEIRMPSSKLAYSTAYVIRFEKAREHAKYQCLHIHTGNNESAIRLHPALFQNNFHV